MVRKGLTTAWTVAAIGLAGLPAGAAAAQQCSTGDAAAAAAAIYGEGTEVVRTEQVAGLSTALVLEPYIAPGTRHRLVQAGGQWCSAETALNRSWLASGRAVGDGRALAAAYARLAAAPYFDETSVTSHTTAAGVHRITTHARTNGVTAAWVVTTDGSGVRSATWTATGFGVKPLVAQTEGLTALRGATERYTRVADGLVEADRGLPARADVAVDPALTLTYTTPDDWKLHVVAGDSRQMVDSGTDTGVYEVDKAQMRTIRKAIGENYQEFYDWGFRANWAPPRTRAVLLNSPVAIPADAKSGYVYVDDALSPYCLACVFIADDFQIHMSAAIVPALTALGFSYPAGREYDAYSNILGHEMFHNWQNNYVKPTSTGRSTPGSYSEGTARFQETLHSYSDVSHQSESLVYDNGGNGCNGAYGAAPDAGLATGNWVSPSYAACQWWLPWYTSAGPAAFARLVSEGMPAGATIPEGGSRNSAEKVIQGIQVATGRDYVESAAAFARGYITGEDMVYGSFLGSLAARDWGTFQERWNPAALAVGGTATRTVGNGGLMGVEVTGAFRPQVTGDDVDLAVVRDTPAGNEITYPAAGDLVAGPGEGESVYLLAVKGSQGTTPVALTAATP